MTPHALFCELLASGIALGLSADGGNIVVPTGLLSPAQRAVVLANKPELVAFLLDTRKTTKQLLAAAMRCCDQYGDSHAMRSNMRTDCLATPPHLHADLFDHFQKTYGG